MFREHPGARSGNLLFTAGHRRTRQRQPVLAQQTQNLTVCGPAKAATQLNRRHLPA
jgi:hypothetical protein